MMEAALEGLDAGTAAGRKRPVCIAVTQLTSTSARTDEKRTTNSVALEESVLHYAR